LTSAFAPIAIGLCPGIQAPSEVIISPTPSTNDTDIGICCSLQRAMPTVWTFTHQEQISPCRAQQKRTVFAVSRYNDIEPSEAGHLPIKTPSFDDDAVPYAIM
jgi:hypothetical protein